MTPTQAAAEYTSLSLIAERTLWGSDEWKAATAFAHRIEETSTEQSFDEYLDALESLNTALAA